MQPTLCSRCKKNVAVIFITRIENGESHNEGLCLRCARELHIKPVDEMMEKLGISDADLDNLTGDVAIVIGSEGDGVKRLTKELSDGVISIPQYGKLNSLNAGVAAGIVMFEKARQEKFGK